MSGPIDVALRWPWADDEVRIHSDTGRVAVVGPSGAGKTTLVRAVAGVERRATGHVGIGTHRWQDDARGIFVPAWQRRVGWVPQDARLFPHVDVRANLDWRADEPDPDARAALTAALGIDHLLDRAPRNLSGGERQRVALARALLGRPTALLLDEPFSALDRARRTDVIALVAERLRRHPVPLLLISHDERDLGPLADDVIALG